MQEIKGFSRKKGDIKFTAINAIPLQITMPETYKLTLFTTSEKVKLAKDIKKIYRTELIKDFYKDKPMTKGGPKGKSGMRYVKSTKSFSYLRSQGFLESMETNISRDGLSMFAYINPNVLYKTMLRTPRFKSGKSHRPYYASVHTKGNKAVAKPKFQKPRYQKSFVKINYSEKNNFNGMIQALLEGSNQNIFGHRFSGSDFFERATTKANEMISKKVQMRAREFGLKI